MPSHEGDAASVRESALNALIRNEHERGRCGYGCPKCAAAYLDAKEAEERV